MKKLLVCPKQIGNTLKVCEYVSKEQDIDLEIVNENSNIDINAYDVVVIASGVYAGRAHKNILRWINNLPMNENSNTKFYVFLTWFGRASSDKTAFNQIKSALEEKQYSVNDNFKSCLGGGRFIKKSHPDVDDCKLISNWAKEI